MTTLDVKGKHAGSNLELQGSSSGGMVVLQGILDADGKMLTIHSQVDGTCAAESGIGTLSKVQ
jgi:hypothetical protein